MEGYHQCGKRASCPFAFTTHSGHFVQVPADELPRDYPLHPDYIHPEIIENMKPGTEAMEKAGTIESEGGFPSTQAETSIAIRPKYPPLPKRTRDETVRMDISLSQFSMVYDEFGQLVDANELKKPKVLSELPVTHQLRLIKKAYHHDYRRRFRDIFHPILNKDSLSTKNGFIDILALAWTFRPAPPDPTAKPSEDKHRLAVFEGPPRILDLGCSDGTFCFRLKEEHPDWIVEGLDDTNHWECIHDDMTFKDFVEPTEPKDYFSNVHKSQENPEFIVRNLNRLLRHEVPLPHNLYSLIRARDVFDRVENYRTFLDDAYLLLQPDGVVEFLEVDPRPRAEINRHHRSNVNEAHTSGPATDWTDIIADRFNDHADKELAKNEPSWTARVAEHHKAIMRAIDGVPAANLKDWVQGAGFWDVQQSIHRIPVGGNTVAGQRLKDFLVYQMELENEVPKLRDELPKVEKGAWDKGEYYLNLHIVTARKPNAPRVGDLLMDGQRAEMSDSVMEAMARSNSRKSAQWQRESQANLDERLSGLMSNFNTIGSSSASVKSLPFEKECEKGEQGEEEAMVKLRSRPTI